MKKEFLIESLYEAMFDDDTEYEQAKKEYDNFMRIFSPQFSSDDWNSWNQEQRDAFADGVVKEYLEKYGEPSQLFLNWLEEDNFHTEGRAFDRALGR